MILIVPFLLALAAASSATDVAAVLGAGLCLPRHLEYLLCTNEAFADMFVEAIAWCSSEEGVTATMETAMSALSSLGESQDANGRADTTASGQEALTNEDIMLMLSLKHDMPICIASRVGLCNDETCQDVVHEHTGLVEKINAFTVSAKYALMDPSDSAYKCMTKAMEVDQVYVWEAIFEESWCETKLTMLEMANAGDTTANDVMSLTPDGISDAPVYHARILKFLTCIYEEFDSACGLQVQQMIHKLGQHADEIEMTDI